jgi:hypothetical protein
MNKELELRIVNRWPDWFDVKGDLRRTLMPFGFDCGDGWFDLIWNLCEEIEEILPKLDKLQRVENKLDNAPKQFEVVQVKQKFASLRFYVNGNADYEINQKIFDLISKAEDLSGKTCEECGQPGEIRGERYLQTLCETCWNKE